MLSLKFTVNKQRLMREDNTTVVADSRNYLIADFTFIDDIWDNAKPKIATFNRIDKENCCYSVFVENGRCIVPWEVLVDKGRLEVSLQGGDLITTNPVTIAVERSGAKNGLQPTKSSPSVYSYITNAVKRFLAGDFKGVKITADSIETENGTINDLNVSNISNYTKIKSEDVSNKLSSNSIKLHELRCIEFETPLKLTDCYDISDMFSGIVIYGGSYSENNQQPFYNYGRILIDYIFDSDNKKDFNIDDSDSIMTIEFDWKNFVITTHFLSGKIAKSVWRDDYKNDEYLNVELTDCKIQYYDMEDDTMSVYEDISVPYTIYITDSVDNINAKNTSTDNITVNKKATIYEIVSDFVTNKYQSVKNKFKFNSNGFDLSVESTDTKGKMYKHQIKTSNSKMQINGADLAFNSEKNERHDITGKYQVWADDEVEIAAKGGRVFRATNNQTGIYSSSQGSPDTDYIEVDGYNTRIGASNDIAVDSNNFRVNTNGTAEIINDYNGGLIRFIQNNTSENKTVKCYLGSDNAIIGVDGDISYSKSSNITAGIKVGSKSVELVGNVKSKGIKDIVMESIALQNDGIRLKYDCSNPSDEKSNVTGILCNNGTLFIYGNGEMFDIYYDWDNTDYDERDDLHAEFGTDYGTNYLKDIKKVYIDNGVTSIGKIYFKVSNADSNLTEVHLSNTIKVIKDYAFHSCGALTSITIPNGVTNIGNWAFGNCYSLLSVTIPHSVTNIGEYAFSECESLPNIIIPDGVISIGKGAFKWCHYLVSITISNSVTSIGLDTFGDCDNLTTITINKPVGSISGAPWGATNAEIIWNG